MQAYSNFELPENMKQLSKRLSDDRYCIRDTSLEAINQAMQHIANNTESMSIEYFGENAPFSWIHYPGCIKRQYNVWKIEYGTTLISDTYVARTPLYHLHNFNVSKVCEIVRQRFPVSAHELEPFDIDGIIPPPPERIRKWTVVGVSVYSSHNPGESPTFVLEFTRQAGDRSTRFWIYEHVISLIDNVIMWNSRGAYLSLMEGTECKNKEPVCDYLFNDMIGRELCAFLPR
jgi:hypothetical protein